MGMTEPRRRPMRGEAVGGVTPFDQPFERTGVPGVEAEVASGDGRKECECETRLVESGRAGDASSGAPGKKLGAVLSLRFPVRDVETLFDRATGRPWTAAAAPSKTLLPRRASFAPAAFPGGGALAGERSQ